MKLSKADEKKIHEDTLDLVSPNRFKYSKAAISIIKWFIFLSVVFFIIGILLSLVGECPLVNQECSLVNIALTAPKYSGALVLFLSITRYIKRVATQNWD